MEKNNILKAVLMMAEDDNQGISMSTTLTDVKYEQRGAIVSFGVEKAHGEEAHKELLGIGGKYMVCCFFIDREELQKYK